VHRKKQYILGVDEVGRGPLAGPVTVCVSKIELKNILLLKKEIQHIAHKKYPVLTDSKKMTEKEREFWFDVLKKVEKKNLVTFFVASRSAKDIDTKGIAVCIRELVDTLVLKATKNIQLHTVELKADKGLKTKLDIQQKDIVKGDEKEFVISIASVYAKVTRDMYMKKIAQKYPEYGFEIHKGYGTQMHRSKIEHVGLSVEHRKSFCKRFTEGD
jgi:ribonuclease HII